LGFAYDVFATESGRCEADTEFSSRVWFQSRSQNPIATAFTTFPTVTDRAVSVLSVWPTPTAAELACLRDLAWLWSPIHISHQLHAAVQPTLQHELGAGFLLEAGMSNAWAASCSIFGIEPTVCCSVNGQPPSETNLEQRRPFPDSGDLFESKSWANSSYSGLVTNINKLFQRIHFPDRLHLVDASIRLGIPLRVVCDDLCLKMSTTWPLERGLCAFDVPHHSRSVGRSSCFRIWEAIP